MRRCVDQGEDRQLGSGRPEDGGQGGVVEQGQVGELGPLGADPFGQAAIVLSQVAEDLGGHRPLGRLYDPGHRSKPRHPTSLH